MVGPRIAFVAISLATLALTACESPPPAPLGAEAFTFYGSTKDSNQFNNSPDGGGGAAGGGVPNNSPGGGTPTPRTIRALVLSVDTNANRFTGAPADFTAWRNTKFNQYQSQLEPYFKENSFGIVGAQLHMRDERFALTGTFDDHFNRPYIRASLRTTGLAAATYPLAIAGASAVIHVRDLHDRNDEVTLAPSGTFPDLNAIVANCQTTFDAVRPSWVVCEPSGAELSFRLVDAEVKEGSFLRVKSGTNHTILGLVGPLEEPGTTSGTTQASLFGTPVAFPITLATAATVQFEVRNGALVTRRYTVNVPAGTIASGAVLANLFPPVLNVEFDWVESNPQADRLGLRIKTSHTGDNAAVRIVGGTNLAALGLAGPVRVDGVINIDGTVTVRTANSVPEALSLFIAKRASEQGVAITSGSKAQLDALVASELDGFDTVMVLFIDTMTGIPGRRAAATSSAYYNLSIPGTGGYTYVKQRHSGLMIGTGAEDWQTWAHESGHVLGFWDIYAQSSDDALFNRTFDYLRDWSMMGWHPPASHMDAWHKNMVQWLGGIGTVDPPAAGATETSKFTLAPLEHPFSDYATTGDANFPLQHLVRVKLADDHWIHLENREPGPAYSHALPDDTVGNLSPSPTGLRGGIIATDTVDPWSPFFFRQAVTMLNPHGTNIARGLRIPDVFDLMTTYPAYGGIKVRVVDSIPGPAGKPRALRVEVDRGPGDFLDLAIRPWQAPTIYASPDIWIDWPGNGTEDYPTTDPPVGNGDDTHWHPDGTVLNYIRVRVKNHGTIEAKGVKVRTSVNLPMGMGDHGTFVPLPDSGPQDIPAGGFKDFVFDWKPTSKGHTCILAQVLTHSTALGELVVSNNAGQENIDDFSPEAGSPYKPVDFEFTVNSRYDRPLKVRLLPTGLVDGLDLEVEDPEFIVPPRNTVKLKGRFLTDITKIPPIPQERRQPIRVQLHALRETGDSWLPFGGISFNINPARTSKIEWNELVRDKRSEESMGRDVLVYGKLSGPSVANQMVDAAIVAVDKESYGGTAKTSASGDFTIRVKNVPPGDGNVMVYYFGPNMTASSDGPKKAQVP